MYLKRLEIFGFKTFAERTDLEFGPGITAIVGPNGSGKSNISDSILWVLGEQSMKSLRSSKSIDVIFNGSDARKALGMAEVHLTLDNSSGRLPTDYTEVTVTRRVFRSGESEYLINRVPVRLRDVHDLFMDTGIGKQSYSTISQGEVDAILSTRSEDRRALFEEVAGIAKYKARKKEALRKLDQTRQNLLRASDVIDELQTQLGPLIEQSEKARQYQGIHEELTRLQLSLLVAQYTGLRSSMGRSQEREAELEKELEGIKHRLHRAELEETTRRAELQVLEDELEQRRSHEGKLGSAVQAAENALALLKQQEDTARRELERLQSERAEWQGESGRFDAEIAAAEAEGQRLGAIIAGLETELAETDAALKEASGAVNELAKDIQQRRGAYMDVLDRMAKARNELARVESLLRASEGRTARIMAELGEIGEKLAERDAELFAARAAIAERQAERERVNARRGEAMRARAALAEKQAELRKAETRVREELAGMRSRRQALRELEESLEGYFPGVRAVMDAAAAGRLRGQFTAMAEIVDVPVELETAIEVAMGAGLQDVVTDSEASARAAVDLLKSTGAGRATFLPLDLLSPDRRASVPGASGIFGLAIEQVTYDPRYEAAVQHHLGRAIVARDLDSALALAKSNTAKGWNRIVTLDGEVITPARAITGGAQGKAGGLLKRKRELRDLIEAVEGKERDANILQRKAQEAAAEVGRLEAELAALAKEAEKAVTALAEAERKAAGIGHEVKTLGERKATLEEENSWIARELESARGEEAKHNAALNALEVEKGEAEAAIGEAESALAGGQSERDAVTERYAALRLKMSEARGELGQQQAAARKAAELRDSLSERLAQNEKLAAEITEKIDAFGKQQREGEAQLARLREAYGKGSAEVEAARDRRAAMLEAIATQLEGQKELRETVEDCQGRLHRANLRTTQVEAELGFLEGQFFDDYRLTHDQALSRAEPVENRAAAVLRLKELQAAEEELGQVNLGAIEESERVGERLTFLTTQRRDLEEARERLMKVIAEIDATCREKFIAAFEAIRREFQDLFTRLFNGGDTQLELEDPSDVLESGIDVRVTIPGKRNQHLLQLSGGERALTALALLFAMLRVKPSPFVVLDEIDAPLDEANVGRYCEVLRDFTADTQFLIVTHNKGTMEAADVLYGVTMEKAGVSKIVSVRLADHRQEVASG